MLTVIDSQLKVFRQRIYNRSTDSVKTSCYLISAAAEFSACVEDSINNCSRRNLLLRVYTCRNTTSVIGNSDNIARQKFYIYERAVACKSLVDSVINDLINQMMQSLRSCRADVHTRSLSYRFKTFKYLYLIFVIVIVLVDC